MKDLKKLLWPIIERANDYGINRMKDFSGISDAALTKMGEKQVNLFPMTAQIIVAGLEVEIVYRMHFSLTTIKKILSQKEEPEACTDELAADYMREYCNVISGQIKAVLDLCDISLAHGLPFVVAGLSDTLAPSDNPKNRLTSFWKIEGKTWGALGCSLLIEIKEESVLAKIARIESVEKDLAQSGEVELF